MQMRQKKDGLMRMLKALCLACYFLCLAFNPLGAETQEPESASSIEFAVQDPVAIDLIGEEDSIQPGRPFWIAIHLNIEDRWHAYWKNPGDAGMPPVVTWNLPKGFTAGPLQWPAPKRFVIGTSIGFGYDHTMVLLAKITPPASFTQDKADISADIRWVVCNNEICLPGESHAALQLPLSSQPKPNAANSSLFTEARKQIPQKNNSVAAMRKQNLVELNIHSQQRIFHRADYFPEGGQTIDYTKETALQQNQEDPSLYTIVLRESERAAALKGVLVVDSSEGTLAYDVDTPIISDGSDKEIGLASSMGLKGEELDDQTLPTSFEGGVGLAIVFAFLGGMILNLMPCVLPVISFKILGFIKMARQSRKLIFKHGLAFSSGVLLSFWVLAGLLLVLQSYGRSVGWGFQLQEPIFVAILAAFLFVFGLSLFGIFEIGTSLIGAAGQAQEAVKGRNAMFGSFMSGILATAVATPCTGPFLGSAVGFAVTLPALQAMLIFTSLGLGMSAPYIALTIFPGLLRFLPKPGPWMEVFKELMGFFMMATVLWLLWVFSAQTNPFAIIILLTGFFNLAVACWIYGKWGTPLQKKMTRTTGRVLAATFLGLGTYMVILATSSWVEAMGGGSDSPSKILEKGISDAWEEFSPERVAELHDKGIPVFIDFTAKWCLICQANHLVLSAEEVANKFTELGVVRMKADWTKNDDIIAAELRKFGRNSVPLYILYGTDPKSKPAILPQVLTPETVMEHLAELK
jgi:thiol:disulfide interchange protein